MDVDWMFAVASHGVLGFELCKLSVRLCNNPNWDIISTDCLYRPIAPGQCVSMKLLARRSVRSQGSSLKELSDILANQTIRLNRAPRAEVNVCLPHHEHPSTIVKPFYLWQRPVSSILLYLLLLSLPVCSSIASSTAILRLNHQSLKTRALFGF